VDQSMHLLAHRAKDPTSAIEGGGGILCCFHLPQGVLNLLELKPGCGASFQPPPLLRCDMGCSVVADSAAQVLYGDNNQKASSPL